MSRGFVVAGALVWVGATLVLSERRAFARRPLADRLRAHARNPRQRAERAGVLSVESFRDVVQPLAQALGGGAARAFGVREDVARRLDRIQSDVDPAAFRIRQLWWALGSLAGALLVVATLPLPPTLGLLGVLAAPVLAFLVSEQRLAAESDAWRERTLLELPVVAEQVGMLLAAGYSLGAALGRIAARSSGACARDLARAQARAAQGLTQAEALGEWATRVEVEAVERFVSILALDRGATDLGRLIAEEARATRRDVQRRRAEQVQRRAQQVWIPVTVATLLPGTVFVAIPFLQAMRLFSAS